VHAQLLTEANHAVKACDIPTLTSDPDLQKRQITVMLHCCFLHTLNCIVNILGGIVIVHCDVEILLQILSGPDKVY